MSWGVPKARWRRPLQPSRVFLVIQHLPDREEQKRQRHPVAARVQDFAVLIDAERTAGRVGAIEGLEDAVSAKCPGVASTNDLLGADGARRNEAGDAGNHPYRNGRRK